MVLAPPMKTFALASIRSMLLYGDTDVIVAVNETPFASRCAVRRRMRPISIPCELIGHLRSVSFRCNRPPSLARLLGKHKGNDESRRHGAEVLAAHEGGLTEAEFNSEE
jgi:hypothetical protein